MTDAVLAASPGFRPSRQSAPGLRLRRLAAQQFSPLQKTLGRRGILLPDLLGLCQERLGACNAIVPVCIGLPRTSAAQVSARSRKQTLDRLIVFLAFRLTDHRSQLWHHRCGRGGRDRLRGGFRGSNRRGTPGMAGRWRFRPGLWYGFRNLRQRRGRNLRGGDLRRRLDPLLRRTGSSRQLWRGSGCWSQRLPVQRPAGTEEQATRQRKPPQARCPRESCSISALEGFDVASGKLKRNVVPLPVSLESSILPSCS